MRTTLLALVVAVALLSTGCATTRESESTSGKTAPAGSSAVTPGYDDQQIARIKRGDTTEAQLLEWFGPPESRDVGADGREQLKWAFSRRTNGGSDHSGSLNVNLGPDGKVVAYSARRSP